MGLFKRVIETPLPYVVHATGVFDGNDGSWSTFTLRVGSPALQFRALVSTSSYYTRVVSKSGCISGNSLVPDCPSERGEDGTNTGYDDTTSSSRNTSTSGDYEFTINDQYLPSDPIFGPPPDNINSSYTDNNNGTFGLDQMQLLPAITNVQPLTVSSVPLGGLVQSQFFLSSIGLGLGSTQIGPASVPSLLDILYDSSLTPSKSFGYTAGAAYRSYSGSLIIGGYDALRIDQPQSDFKLPRSLGYIIPQVTITDITVKDVNGITQSITTTSGETTSPFDAVIESTLPYLYFPRSICDKFQEVFGLQFDENTLLYRVNDTQRQVNNGSSIRFVMSDTVSQSTTFSIDFPYAAFDLETKWPIGSYNGSGRFFPIRRSPTDDAIHVLGRTFLQETYLIIDYEKQNFTLGKALFPDSNSFSLQSILSDKYSSQPSMKQKLSTGALAGIIVGSIIVTTFILGIIFFLWYRKRRAVKGEERKGAEEEAKTEMRSRSGTIDTVLTGTTEATHRPPYHDRRISELSHDFSASSGPRSPVQLYELPEEGKPMELEDNTDTAAWIRNSERMSNVGQGRFFELMGDFPPGAPASTSSTPRFMSATPVNTPPPIPTYTTAENMLNTQAAMLAARNSNRSSLHRNPRRTNSGGMSSVGTGAGSASPHGSTTFAVTPLSERQTPLLEAAVVSEQEVSSEAAQCCSAATQPRSAGGA